MDRPANENSAPREPMLNIPPLTLWLTILLAVCFAAMTIMPERIEPYLLYLCFIPKVFGMHPLMFSYTTLSYGLLHFGWPHILMNTFGLLAFGSGVERLLGKKFFMVIFLGGMIFGAISQWALFPDSMNPLGGASAGISALFGAILPLVIRKGSILKAIIVFMAMNLIFGLMGLPHQEGATIAWQAHIAGFVWGLALIMGRIWKIEKQSEV